MKEKGYLMNLCRLSFRFFLCSRGRHSFKTISHLFRFCYVILLLHNHRAGDGGGDIETILSELNSAYPEKPVISPDPSEKRTKQNMDSEAPEKVPALASSREGNKKQVTSSRKEEQSETKTLIPPRAKRQKRKDKTQLISDGATLKKQQPSPLMILPPAVPRADNDVNKAKKKNKRQRLEEDEDDASKESKRDTADDDDGTKHDDDVICTEGDGAAGDNGGAAEDSNDDVKHIFSTDFCYRFSPMKTKPSSITKPSFSQQVKPNQKRTKRRKTSGKELAAPTDDEQEATTNKDKCEIKAGAAFDQVNRAWNLLEERHRQDVRTAGFGSIEECQIKRSICKPLAAHIYDNLDTESMTITFGDADQLKEIKITKEAIHKVFGYPNGTEKSAPRPEKSPTSMKELITELGLKKMDFHHDDLFKELQKLVKVDDEQSNRKSVKIFFLIFFHNVVCGTTSPTFSKQAIMVKDLDYPEMAKMDFCEVIVESIKEGAKIWQKHRLLPQEEKNKKHLNGLAQGPVIMYLDSLLLPTDTIEMRKIAKTMDKTSLPRANHLKESDLKKIARADMKRDGKARPDDYEFGKIKV